MTTRDNREPLSIRAAPQIPSTAVRAEERLRVWEKQGSLTSRCSLLLPASEPDLMRLSCLLPCFLALRRVVMRFIASTSCPLEVAMCHRFEGRRGLTKQALRSRCRGCTKKQDGDPLALVSVDEPCSQCGSQLVPSSLPRSCRVRSYWAKSTSRKLLDDMIAA